MAAEVGIDLIIGHIKNFCGRGSMNVYPLSKSLLECLDICHASQETQFDLTIVGSYQLMAGASNKTLADFASLIAAYRNVLQVGIVRSQAAGIDHGLVIGGMDTRVLIQQIEQGIGISGF